jgi:hypothetical protein
MKRTILTGLVAAGLLMSGAIGLSLAQNGPGAGRNGCGYGGPPQSQEERAARQAACVATNCGTCTNTCTNVCPRAACPGRCLGKAKGHGYRHGLCDGTGPRNTNGVCPFNGHGAAKK